jgi:hypothetical protein
MKEIIKNGVNPQCDRVKHRYKSKRQDGGWNTDERKKAAYYGDL